MLTMGTSARTDNLSSFLLRINGGSILFYNGAKPASLGAPAGTLLGTLTLANPAGTVSAGVFTLGSFTQNNSLHVNGTPTFVRYLGPGGLVEADIDIGAGAGNVQFSGTIVNGQNITATSVTLTAGNA